MPASTPHPILDFCEWSKKGRMPPDEHAAVTASEGCGSRSLCTTTVVDLIGYQGMCKVSVAHDDRATVETAVPPLLRFGSPPLTAALLSHTVDENLL